MTYGHWWLLREAPALLLPVVWLLFALRTRGWLRRSLVLGALGLLALQGLDVLAVAGGGLPSPPGPWQDHVRWTVLGLALWVSRSSSHRYGPVSAAVGTGLLVVGGWLPGLVVLGRGRFEQERWDVIGWTIAVAAGRIFARDGTLWTAHKLGWLGLSMDGTTLAGTWLAGTPELFAWAGLLWSLSAWRASPK